jgi:hypothetical protein
MKGGADQARVYCLHLVEGSPLLVFKKGEALPPEPAKEPSKGKGK